MDDIGQRLKECSENCIAAYDGWSGSKKDIEARERLQEAVHELRKVSARLEIEMAVSERDEMAQRPLPVPSHRSMRRKDQGGNDLPDFITEGNGNSADGEDGGRRPQRSPRPSGGGSGGGVRRPQQQRRPKEDDSSGNAE